MGSHFVFIAIAADYVCWNVSRLKKKNVPDIIELAVGLRVTHNALQVDRTTLKSACQE